MLTIIPKLQHCQILESNGIILGLRKDNRKWEYMLTIIPIPEAATLSNTQIKW
jgi:hypothetical protein